MHLTWVALITRKSVLIRPEIHRFACKCCKFYIKHLPSLFLDDCLRFYMPHDNCVSEIISGKLFFVICCRCCCRRCNRFVGTNVWQTELIDFNDIGVNLAIFNGLKSNQNTFQVSRVMCRMNIVTNSILFTCLYSQRFLKTKIIDILHNHCKIDLLPSKWRAKCSFAHYFTRKWTANLSDFHGFLCV